MSKVVRLNDLVLKNLDKVSEYLKSNTFEDDPVAWHLVYDDADENYFIQYLLLNFMHDRGID